MDYGFTLASGVGRDALLAEAGLGEQLGYERIALGEHLFFKSPTTSSVVALSAAAAVTSRIRLLSSVLLLPLYPAALAVKQIESLARISAGRFELGVGVGGEYPPEFDAVGVPVRERGRRTEEALTLLRTLWRGGQVAHRGLSGDVVDLALDPPPTGPPPPVWMGGRREAAMRRAAGFADVWFPYMVTPEQLAESLDRVAGLAAERGREPGSISGGLFVWTFVGDSDAEARAAATAYVSDVYDQDFTRLADRYLLSGDRDRVASRLREYADAGVESVVFALACPDAQRSEQLRRLASEIVAARGPMNEESM